MPIVTSGRKAHPAKPDRGFSMGTLALPLIWTSKREIRRKMKG
jgi:hypothetical protein